MTSAEFKVAFETRFYAATTVNGLGWSNDEISEFLNYSQNSLVSAIVESGNLEAISNLIRISEIVIPEHALLKTEVKYPRDDFFKLINATLFINSQPYSMDIIEAKEVYNFIANPQNLAIFRKPKIAVIGDGYDSYINFSIIQGTYIQGTQSKVEFQFVQNPAEIDIDNSITTNLNIVLHDKVVDIAVQKAVETYIKTGQSTQ